MQLFAKYPDVMTILEVAEALRVPASVVDELTENGEITSLTIGENKIVLKSNLINYIEKLSHVCYGVSNEMHLDNRTDADTMPCSESEVDDMAKRINQSVVINGEKHWITVKSAQEFADKVASLIGSIPQPVSQPIDKHPFDRGWIISETFRSVAGIQCTSEQEIKGAAWAEHKCCCRQSGGMDQVFRI